ncbi:unnamed protein product [Ceratitis capitata]|uniref:(Mediterranean fruit fly) hypothetical protein n=1 Tax=Ceratitis capitata TaxID=7213 RepID=A0A811UJF0_CERCA|nr:unnamed protein product [Ceratitis capitata]
MGQTMSTDVGTVSSGLLTQGNIWEQTSNSANANTRNKHPSSPASKPTNIYKSNAFLTFTLSTPQPYDKVDLSASNLRPKLSHARTTPPPHSTKQDARG